jgi:hypothetical protein
MKTNNRIVVAVGLLLLVCWGCAGPEEVKKKLAEADGLWSVGKKAEAVREYKIAYSDRWASADNKTHMLPRIVETALEAGDRKAAEEWMMKGLKDQLTIQYSSPAAKELLLLVRKEYEKAEAARKTKEARKAEEEYDGDGLVLLKNTLHGQYTDHGNGFVTGEITGEVVNRRSHTLSYVQITFNLYDDSGAQVGSALANVNGLEPGSTWKFKAVTTGHWTKYKVSKLMGL